MIKKVLVTGGAGYVGSLLVPKLLNWGYQIKVLDLYLYGDDVLDSVKNNPNLEQIKGDIRDKALLEKVMQGCDAVFHLACISNDPSFELNPALGKSINYDAFLDLVDVAKSNQVKRFIYASSSSVYGINPNPNVREDASCQPLTDYSKYKLLCENILKESNLNGMEYVIVRPATVCGYAPRLRLDLVVNILTMQALTKKEITVTGGPQLRPNINIKDMVDVYQLLLEAPRGDVHAEVFNAGSENFSVTTIANLVKEAITDSEISIKIMPTNDIRSYHINSDKIKAKLGFQTKHGIADAVQSIQYAYTNGWIPNILTDSRYYNIKRMTECALS